MGHIRHVSCGSPLAVDGLSLFRAQRFTEHARSARGCPDAGQRLVCLTAKNPVPLFHSSPPATPTILDGNYAKVEPQVGTYVPCKRCPDYIPEGGVWKLNLDKGVFRIWHEATGWRSIGSFTAFYDQESRDRVDQLALFNDPYCPGVVGLYTWQREEGELVLQVVGDTCSMGLRAVNLANRSWLSCQPPSAEAGITDHWKKPPGCD